MNKITVKLSGLNFPEGPLADFEGNVWLVELKGGDIVKISPDSKLVRFPTGGAPNGLAMDSAGTIWFCDSRNNCVSVLNPNSGAVEKMYTSIDGETPDMPNDLAFDERGNILFTCPGNSRTEPTGYVCCANSKRVKKIADGKFFPNGLAFSEGGKTLVVAETSRHRLWLGGWDSRSEEWIEPRPWAKVGGPIGPDGMAFGRDGNLYVAVFGQSAIKVVSPNGEIARVIELSGKNPTNCAFARNGGLLVTEAEKGELLIIDIDVRGIL